MSNTVIGYSMSHANHMQKDWKLQIGEKEKKSWIFQIYWFQSFQSCVIRDVGKCRKKNKKNSKNRLKKETIGQTIYIKTVQQNTI